MLTELCQELRNWFDRDQVKMSGTFTINGDSIVNSKGVQISFLNGQHFRIMGSALNDGVHQYSAEMNLLPETFSGSLWAMAVPPAVIALSEQIDAWKMKYGAVDSQAMSPYNSESFGGYSYSKGGASAGGGNAASWESVFANALNRWRKI